MAKIVTIDKIEDGMVSIEAIVNRFGQTLLPAGIELKQNHIRLLKTWNIRAVKVKMEDEEEDAPLNSQIYLMLKEKILQRMKWEPRVPIEENLVESAVLFAAKLKNTNINNLEM